MQDARGAQSRDNPRAQPPAESDKDADDGSQVADPEVIFRGVPFAEEADGLRDELREVVEDTLADAAEEQIREVSLLQQDLHDDIAEFVYEKLRRRPLVLPVVVEV